MLAVRAETPRSAHLPRRMAAVVVVQALALLLQVRGGAEAASVLKARRLPQQALMALAAAAPAARLLASALWVVAVVVPVVRRQALQELLACTHVMAVLELRLVAASTLVAVLLPGARVARASGRPLAQLTAQAVHRALLVPHPLPVGCSGRVEAAAVQTQVEQAAQAVLEAVALVAAVAVLRAVHTLLAPVVSAVMAGH